MKQAKEVLEELGYGTDITAHRPNGGVITVPTSIEAGVSSIQREEETAPTESEVERAKREEYNRRLQEIRHGSRNK